jgi:hypothetical protein
MRQRLAVFSLFLGHLLVTWFFAEQIQVNRRVSRWEEVVLEIPFILVMALLPYGLLALAAQWRWTSRAGWWVLLVSLMIVGAVGAMVANGAPYRGIEGIAVMMFWVVQMIVTTASITLSLIIWFVARRRAVGS